MARLLPLLAVSLLGCRFDPAGIDPDDLGPASERLPDGNPDTAAVDAGEAPDTAAVDAGAPDAISPTAPFGAPSPVAPLNTTTEDEDDPTLTGDMLELYFNRGADIWVSTRSKVTASWGAPKLATELSSTSTETNPEIAPNGLTIFFASTRPHPSAKGGYDIYVSTRPAPGKPWSTPKPVEELNTPDSDHPGPAPDLLTMVVISDRPGTKGQHDLLMSTRSSLAGAWGAPWPLNALNTSTQEAAAWLDATACLIYYGSSRQASNHDIWVSTRAGKAKPFATPVNVKTLNSPDAEEDPWLSADLRTVYFSSNRAGTNDIYVATR